MARRRPKRPSPPQPAGILSGVLSFVSRELGSFVASATGGPIAGPSSRALEDEDGEGYSDEYSDEDEDEDKDRRRRRKRSRSPPRKRSRRARSHSHSRRRSISPSTPAPKPSSTSRKAKKRRRHEPSSSSEDEHQDASSAESSHSPQRVASPPPPISLSKILKRRPSFTMPGSLFPRSPSMEPDARPDQRVRFKSESKSKSKLRPSPSPSPSPPPTSSPATQPPDSQHTSDAPHASPTSPTLAHPSSSSASFALTPASPSTPRRRSKLASSVQSAMEKFHVGEDDADASILLPSPTKSPHALGAGTYAPSSRRADGSESVSVGVNTNTASIPEPSRARDKDKGKGRAVDPGPYNYDTQDVDSSGFLRVQGKEQELFAAREEFDRRHWSDRDHDDHDHEHEHNHEGEHEHKHEHEGDGEDKGEAKTPAQATRDRDKDRARIRMLEDEVERLKQELSKRPSTHTYPPPPPPPPPPGTLPLATLPRKTLIDLPLASTTSTDPNLFASARASLKQAPVPVENPIVPLRRPGIATVGLGLAPDKMAAFLTEMKTVRLRKTGSGVSLNSSAGGNMSGHAANATFTAPTPPSRVAQLAPRRSLSLKRPPVGLRPGGDAEVSKEDWAALREKVRLEMDGAARTGDKRKRAESSHDHDENNRGPTKRHSPASASNVDDPAHSSFSSISTSESGSSARKEPTQRNILPARTTTAIAPPSRYNTHTVTNAPTHISSNTTTQTWQTSSVTSAPTPSLCSDNEPDAPSISPDDRHLMTPPATHVPFNEATTHIPFNEGPSRVFYQPRKAAVAEEERSRRGLRRRDVDGDTSLRGGVGNASRGGAGNTSGRAGNGTGSGLPVRPRVPQASGIPRLRTNSRPGAPPVRRASPARVQAEEETQAQVQEPMQTQTRVRGSPSFASPPPSHQREEHENDHSQHHHENPPQQADDDVDEEEEGVEDAHSSFIHPSTLPRANISTIFDQRLPSSPLPAKSPRRPRAPARVASGSRTSSMSGGSASVGGAGAGNAAGTGTGAGAGNANAKSKARAKGVNSTEAGHTPGPVKTRKSDAGRTPGPGIRKRAVIEEEEEEEEEEEVLPAREHAASPTPLRVAASRARPLGLGHASASQPSMSTSTSSSTLKRRLTLDDELRNAVPFLHEGGSGDEEEEEEDEYMDGSDGHIAPADAYMAEVAHETREEVQQHHREVEEIEVEMGSGVLVGVGTRSRTRGFLAHGGAGGTPVFMGVGYVEGAEEEVQGEEGYDKNEYRREDVYGDEGYGDEDEDGRREVEASEEGDDGEYLPSPQPRVRQNRSRRRR